MRYMSLVLTLLSMALLTACPAKNAKSDSPQARAAATMKVPGTPTPPSAQGTLYGTRTNPAPAVVPGSAGNTLPAVPMNTSPAEPPAPGTPLRTTELPGTSGVLYNERPGATPNLSGARGALAGAGVAGYLSQQQPVAINVNPLPGQPAAPANPADHSTTAAPENQAAQSNSPTPSNANQATAATPDTGNAEATATTQASSDNVGPELPGNYAQPMNYDQSGSAVGQPYENSGGFTNGLPNGMVEQTVGNGVVQYGYQLTDAYGNPTGFMPVMSNGGVFYNTGRRGNLVETYDLSTGSVWYGYNPTLPMTIEDVNRTAASTRAADSVVTERNDGSNAGSRASNSQASQGNAASRAAGSQASQRNAANQGY